MKVSGTLDGSPESFTALTLDISAAAKDEDLLRKLASIAERSCQVTNTLRASVPISLLVQGSALESVTT